MSNQNNQPLTMTDKVIKYVVISLISIIVIALIIFLFIPRLSVSIFGYGSYGTTTSTDSSLKVEDLKIISNKDFDDLKLGTLFFSISQVVSMVHNKVSKSIVSWQLSITMLSLMYTYIQQEPLSLSLGKFPKRCIWERL